MTLPLSEHTRQWINEHGFDDTNINVPGKYDDIPLTLAARQGDTDIANELIYLGSDIDHRNMDGTTPLWACVVSNNFSIAKALLDAGANIDNQNDNGATTLMYAASSGKISWVKFLIENGADTQLKSLDDFTALELASNVECLRLLKAASQLAM